MPDQYDEASSRRANPIAIDHVVLSRSFSILTKAASAGMIGDHFQHTLELA